MLETVQDVYELSAPTPTPEYAPEEELPDLREWTIKWFKFFGYSTEEYIPLETFFEQPSISAECGDDFAYIGIVSAFCRHLAILEILGCKISENDTSLNELFGTYTEGVVRKPSSYFQTWHNVRKTHNPDLSYLDIPKLRVLLATCSTRIKVSDTVEGKTSVLYNSLGVDIYNQRQPHLYAAAVMIQITNLGLQTKRPYILPKTLGGLGGDIPYHTADNLQRYLSSWRRGRYKKYCFTVLDLVNKFHREYGEDPSATPDELLLHLSKFERGFHDWVKSFSQYMPNYSFDIPEDIRKKCLFRLSDLTSEQYDLANVLLSQGEVVSETALEVALAAKAHLEIITGGEEVASAKTRLDDFRKNLRKGLSNWGAEILGMVSQKVYHLPEEGEYEAIASYYCTVERKFLRREVLSNERIYPKETLDEIYKRGPFKVKLDLQPTFFGDYRAMARSDFVEDEGVGASKEALEYLLAGCKGDPPQKVKALVSDDPRILRQIRESTSPIITVVTDDVKLLREAAWRYRSKRIIRYPVARYYAELYLGIREFSPEGEVLMDEGSILSGEERHFYNGVFCHYSRHPLLWNEVQSPLRREEFNPEQFLDERWERPYVIRPRRKRRFR